MKAFRQALSYLVEYLIANVVLALCLAPLLELVWNLSLPTFGLPRLSYLAAAGILGFVPVVRMAARGIQVEER